MCSKRLKVKIKIEDLDMEKKIKKNLDVKINKIKAVNKEKAAMQKALDKAAKEKKELQKQIPGNDGYKGT